MLQWRFSMSHNHPDLPEVERMLREMLGIKLIKVIKPTFSVSTKTESPGVRVIQRTKIVSIVQKRGKLLNLPSAGTGDVNE